MGKLTGGIDYDMIGRTGNHVGRRVKGVNVIAMRAAKSNKSPSAAQLDIRLQWALITGWMSGMINFIRIGFEGHTADQSAWNACIKYNFEKAITGVSPAYTIDYEHAKFSIGELNPGMDIAMATTEDAQLDFTWKAGMGSRRAASSDLACFIVYNPAKQEFADAMTALRSALLYDMLLPTDWSGDNVEVWMCFVSADRKAVSTTKYVGATVVQ